MKADYELLKLYAMKTIYYLFILYLVSMITTTGYATNKDQKMLIVYYSWSEGKNTETLAKYIQEQTGADLFRIEAVKPYPLDYNACVKAAKEDIEAGKKPAIKQHVSNIGQYDIIFVGTPNWWSTMAPPVLTFLSDCDLSGKTIIPFNTHGGGGAAHCFTDMEKVQPEAKFLKGLAVRGHKPQADIEASIRSGNSVDKWLKELGIITK